MSKKKHIAHYTGNGQQRGVATVLLVTLIGISVMLATAFVALSVSDKKEASATTHAQANAQTLSWAGVSAFNQYLQNLANSDLNGSSLKEILTTNKKTTLSETEDKQIITAEILNTEDDIVGCEQNSLTCQVTATISADSSSSAAAHSITATFRINEVVQTDGEDKEMSLTGNTIFSGITTLAAEPGVSTVTLNVEGKLSLNLGFRTRGIAELNINATDDVYIDCGKSVCGAATINVTSGGNVTLLNGTNFGEIKALGKVSLYLGAHAQNIQSLERVRLESGSSAKSVNSASHVAISASRVNGDIKSNSYVTLDTGANVSGSITAMNHIGIWTSKVGGDLKANGYIQLVTATIDGSAYSYGNSTVPLSSSVVQISVATNIKGSIYANGRVSILGDLIVSSSVRNVETTDTVTGTYINRTIKGSRKEKQTFPVVSSTIKEQNFAKLKEEIQNSMGRRAYVDVQVYRDEANYIFTENNGFNRVYLNKLLNPTTQKEYIYKDGFQYIEGEDEPISEKGFSIGKYSFENKTYNGAICLQIQNGVCTDDIVGYLPRISVEQNLLGIEDYQHGRILKTWRLRSIFNKSNINNAVLAPGIMYFEGNLELAGEANWHADSSTNAFVNTLLAEGEIGFIAFSPRLYSPFAVLREGKDNAKLVCDRDLQQTNGNKADLVSSDNGTLSNKYLRPTNLCKSPRAFEQMSRDNKNRKIQVTIDGEKLDKLELGEVALMANGHVNLGACMQVYGDVLARKEIRYSAACGITNDKNILVGNVTSGGKSSLITLNSFMSGSNITIPALNKNEGEESNAGLNFSSSLEWAKSL